MKIRWTKNSVRFRITPQELGALEIGETVQESMHFRGEELWRASVEIGDETALQSGNGVTISLSTSDRARLAEPDAEGVYFSEDGFRYYIEKDFPCAHPRAVEAAEPVTDTFVPPPDFEERKN
ncbi:MAG TPA: hypothetical protein VF681_04915 [Abditibacteriaceae bacterium]